MVGAPERHRRILADIAELYGWIDSQLRQNPSGAGRCAACGACCDFPAYDHRLYVTPPELMYLAAKLHVTALKPMPAGRCPYQQDRSCTVHEHRFAACRIFCCRGESAFQSELSEAVVKRLKTICERLDIPYQYQDLSAALEMFNHNASL
jgi:Fe-S-cluster containining protein